MNLDMPTGKENNMNSTLMKHWVVGLAIVAIGGGVSAAYAQGSFEPPRLPDGRPDLQGVWDFRTLTPLQRPEDLADKAVLGAEEAAEIEAKAAARSAELNAPTTERDGLLPAGGDVGGYNHYWVDQGATVVKDQRTSLIVDPPNGRVPPLQPGIEMQALSLSADLGGTRPNRTRTAGIGTDSYEDRGLAERCLLGFNTGPPIVPAAYNQNIQLFQTSEYVVILHEMVHDARVIPLDGRDHLPGRIRQWNGDSRGYWEGDTLVVESTNFTDKTASFNPRSFTAAGSGTTLHLVERFQLVAEHTLQYEYTVTDPVTFTRPFTAALFMKRGEAIFEYACHEGNYGLYNILAGARQQERSVASSNSSGGQ